jgi:hypothetical protein
MSNRRTAYRLEPEFQPAMLPAVNTRLVAAVQSRAGSRCHESANLLHTYYLCADVYRSRASRGGSPAAVDAAWRTLKQAEVRLREFLTPLHDPAAAGVLH